MSKPLAMAITISILMLSIFPLSQVVTRKRVFIIDNASDSLDFQASIFTNTTNQNFPSSDKGKRINTLFLGIPGEKNNAPNLTDTLIVMSVDQETKKGFLLSIPRDFLVKLPKTNSYTKINAFYQETDLVATQKALSEITGLDFDYNILIDLAGVKKIIDQIGGIDIFVEKDIYDSSFPGPNNSYQPFAIKQGQHHLDGETALKYIRTRHDWNGDFARMKRQQQVLIALKEKISSLHPLWNLAVVLNVWQIIKNHFKTNLSIKNIKNFWQMAKEIDLEKIDFRVLETATGILIPDHTILGGEEAYILKPRAGLGNYKEIQEYIGNLTKN